jgi:hypothetical protein
MVIQVLNDRGLELKSFFKSNLGLNRNSDFRVGSGSGSG